MCITLQLPSRTSFAALLPAHPIRRGPANILTIHFSFHHFNNLVLSANLAAALPSPNTKLFANLNFADPNTSPYGTLLLISLHHENCHFYSYSLLSTT